MSSLPTMVSCRTEMKMAARGSGLPLFVSRNETLS